MTAIADGSDFCCTTEPVVQPHQCAAPLAELRELAFGFTDTSARPPPYVGGHQIRCLKGLETRITSLRRSPVLHRFRCLRHRSLSEPEYRNALSLRLERSAATFWIDLEVGDWGDDRTIGDSLYQLSGVGVFSLPFE